MQRLCGVFAAIYAVNVASIRRNRLINRHGQRIVRALQTKGKFAMQLGHTILYVPNVPATLLSYEAVFGLTTRFLHAGCQASLRITKDGFADLPDV